MRRPRVKLIPVLAALGLVVLLGAGLYGGYQWYEAPDRATDQCMSPFVGDMVSKAFDQSDLAQLEHVHWHALRSVKQQSFDRRALTRTCTAVLEASDFSHVNVRYTVKAISAEQVAVSLVILQSDIAPAE